MDEKLKKSKSWVANYFYSKIGEYQHHLEEVVKYCDASRLDYENGLSFNENDRRFLSYAFGSLTAVVQTLKDAGSFFLPNKITWSDIESLDHGKFFHLSRNAATHDGNPIIDFWMDGKFYVGGDIERFDSCGKFVIIKSPKLDVRQFTLEFSLCFYEFLYSRLEGVVGSHDLIVTLFGPERIESLMSLPLIPKEARDIYFAHRNEILASAPIISTDSIERALEKIRFGVDYIKRITY